LTHGVAATSSSRSRDFSLCLESCLFLNCPACSMASRMSPCETLRTLDIEKAVRQSLTMGNLDPT
jgi:hypothetical protein